MARQVVIFATVTVAAFLLAHMTNSMLEQALAVSTDRPSAPSPAPSEAKSSEERARLVEEILGGGLFPVDHAQGSGISQAAVLLGGGPAYQGSVGPASGPPIDAAKKIKLVGTVVAEGLDPFAVVEDISSKRQALYHLSEVIPNVGTIVEVHHDAIKIQAGSQWELLDLYGKTPKAAATGPLASVVPQAASTTPLKHVLDQREVAQTMADLPKLLSEARAVPVYANGKIEGWKIEGVTPQSFFDKIGLRAGDVLQRINGAEVRDPGMMLTLFQQVKNERSIQVDMLRNGQKTTMNYEIR